MIILLVSAKTGWHPYQEKLFPWTHALVSFVVLVCFVVGVSLQWKVVPRDENSERARSFIAAGSNLAHTFFVFTVIGKLSASGELERVLQRLWSNLDELRNRPGTPVFIVTVANLAIYPIVFFLPLLPNFTAFMLVSYRVTQLFVEKRLTYLRGKSFSASL